MTTQSSLRNLGHLWVVSTFLALAFDPLGIKYDVSGIHLARRAGTLGGDAPAITETGDSERPYEVDGNTFTDYDSAAHRSCDIQFDNCQLISNTDASASFSLEDCRNQQNECIADPPAVTDGSSSMSVASINTSENTSDMSETGAKESGILSDNAESDTIGSNTHSETADSNTIETDAEGFDTSETSPVSVVASGAAESEATESDTTNSSDATESDTAGSNTAEADSAESGSTDADKKEADNNEPDTTGANPLLVSQTTIPYDAEFDLVCDL
ncbi:hypothetical protein BDW66DRAFT_127887 [Aspergillus desertorum]